MKKWTVVVRDGGGTRFFGVINETNEGALREALEQMPLGVLKLHSIEEIYVLEMTKESMVDPAESVRFVLDSASAGAKILRAL